MSNYKRVMLKLSGEALSGDRGFGFSKDIVLEIAKQVKVLIDNNIEVAIVIGGGNFVRGKSMVGLDRSKMDQVGMLATIMNAIYVSEIFRELSIDTEVMTPFICDGITTRYSKDLANKAFENKKVVFFAGGTGHPYFSTDTACVLRAIEINADMIFVAKTIDGVYDSDPKENPNAKKYDKISMQQVYKDELKVLDLTATAMCLENKMPLFVFKLNEINSIINAVNGEISGTYVTI